MRDDDALLELDELAEVLRATEGPPRVAARRRSAVASRRRRKRWAVAGAVASAVLLGSGLGFGLASSLTPSGDAADPQSGLGFLPERGWQVVRSKFEATDEEPSFAMASSVPVARHDAQMFGLRKFSGYPYQTLSSLPRNGVVIVASFALRGVHAPSDASFPRRKLPLRLRDAASEIRASFYGKASGGPLGWYELRAAVGQHNVIVSVYFGTVQPRRATIVDAQRQLDRLVVGSTRPSARVLERALPLRPAVADATPAARVLDRTFACSPQVFGGVGDLNLVVTPPRTFIAPESPSTHLIVRSGSWSPTESLVVVRTRPNPGGTGWFGAANGVPGVFAHAQRCSAVRARVPLSAKGLAGPPVQWHKELDCQVRGRVLVHVRSMLAKPADWRRADRTYLGARSDVVESKLAVRLQTSGKPIAYMEHDAKGGTKLWYSGTCG